MTRIQKKVLTQTFLLGIIVTFLVVIADSLHFLDALENFGYDRRARHFQFFTPLPTNTVVHANIDDETLQLVGRWPWDRDLFAQIVGEVRQAGAKVVAMDILFLEAQNPVWRPRAASTPDSMRDAVSNSWVVSGQVGPTTAPASEFVEVDRDAVLAAELARVSAPVMGVLADPSPVVTSEYHRMYRLLHENLELTLDETMLRLGRKTLADSDDLTRYLAARKTAMRDRILALIEKEPGLTLNQVREKLIPGSLVSVNTPLERTLFEQFGHAHSVTHLFKNLAPVPREVHAPFLATELEIPPISRFSEAAKYCGSVTYIQDSDGVARSVPLWTEYRGKIFPQLGLATAMAMLNVNPRAVRFSTDGFSLPMPDGGSRFVPTRDLKLTLPSGKHPGYYFDIPWFGASGSTDAYTTMYDPERKASSQQIAVSAIWKLRLIKDYILANNRNADTAVFNILRSIDPQHESEFLEAKKQFKPEDAGARKPWIKLAAEIAAANGYLRPHKPASTPAEIDEEFIVSAANALQTIQRNADSFQEELNDRQGDLEKSVKDKAVIIGWTATAVIADFVPTSLYGKSPGMIIHGTVYNAIMTNHFWRRSPDWLTAVVSVIVGLLTTACVARFHAVAAFLTSLGILATYILVNCLVVFDYGGYLLGLAGPVVTVAAVWSIGTVFRFVIESRELKRITESFQTRVDPALVKYVIDNPDKVQLTGERRELSVVFTDLAGFTTLSEKLGEDTVTMLNKYMGIMVPAIRRHSGYVNKFLGDGIMFFFGAPAENTDHARQAVVTVIEMQKLLIEFNKELTAQNLPNLKMRAGISTGLMIVGDAGSVDTMHRAADYTVLGDLVNLGARLESANKATGTLMLMTERTVELMGDSILARPVGRLVVVGKTQGVMVYEPLAMRAEATDAQKNLVSLTAEVVKAFQAADFAGCLKKVEAMEAAVGASKITKLYRELSEEYLATPPGEPFDGCITLSEK